VGLTSLLLGSLVIVLDRLDAAGELMLFVLAGVALIPVAWLIGEATANLALYTGPGIGGIPKCDVRQRAGAHHRDRRRRRRLDRDRPGVARGLDIAR